MRKPKPKRRRPPPPRVSEAERARRRFITMPIKDPARWLRRLEAFAALGGACECCGEREPIFLTFDHINGVANEQGGASRRGYELIRWMRARGYRVRGIVRLMITARLCARGHHVFTTSAQSVKLQPVTSCCPSRKGVPHLAESRSPTLTSSLWRKRSCLHSQNPSPTLS
jgi:hypothetical protein